MPAIASPLFAGTYVAIMVGILVLLGGVAQTIYAFQAKSFGAGALALLLGLLTVGCGGVMIAHPLVGLRWLTILLICYFVAEGLCEILASFQMRPISGWGWMLFSGAISLVLGIMLWRQWPSSEVWAIGLLVGIKLLLLGWTMIAVGGVTRGLAKEVQSH